MTMYKAVTNSKKKHAFLLLSIHTDRNISEKKCDGHYNSPDGIKDMKADPDQQETGMFPLFQKTVNEWFGSI